MKSNFFKLFRIKRRAVVRTIDFLVSFTLFIILLTQFYLIIINMNLNIAATNVTQENPAELFADRILSYSGAKDWGTKPGTPTSIGLASDYSHLSLNYFLDLAKLARLNPELQNLSINSQFSYIEPSALLANIVGNNSYAQFRITTRPLIQVSAKLNTGNTSMVVTAKSWSNSPMANINIDNYYVSLTDGAQINGANQTTNYSGQATVTIPGGLNHYVAIVYAHSQASWGITWVVIDNDGVTVSATGISSFLLNNPNGTRNSILQYTKDILVTSHIIYSNSAFYSPATNNLTGFQVTNQNNLINQNLNNVGSSNPFIQVYTMFDGSVYHFRVVTEPLIYDNVGFSGNYSVNQFPAIQTPNYGPASNTYTYTTIVMTDRGPLLFTIDYSSRLI